VAPPWLLQKPALFRRKGLYPTIRPEFMTIGAIGYQSDNRLYDQIKSFGYEIHRIGDCLEARSAKEAIYEGMVLGCSI